MTHLDRALIASTQKLTSLIGLRYTTRQLYYEVCRALRPTPGLGRQTAWWVLAAGFLPALLTWAVMRRPRWARRLAAANVALTSLLYGARRWPYTLAPPISYERFTEALRIFQIRYGPPPGLLALGRPVSMRLEGREPDLFVYGVPRLLVCQTVEVAHMLFTNDFHIELACPVLSVDDASPLPDLLQTMLQRTPEAHVYFLHDASTAGLALVPTLRQRINLPSNIPLTAVGLRPAHAKSMHLFASQTPPAQNSTVDWPYYLSGREQAWLEAGWQAEVEAVPPPRLLRALRRMMLGTVKPSFSLPSLQSEREVGFMTWPEA